MTSTNEYAKVFDNDERTTRANRYQVSKSLPIVSLIFIALCVIVSVPLYVARNGGRYTEQGLLGVVDRPMRLVLLREAALSGAGENILYGRYGPRIFVGDIIIDILMSIPEFPITRSVAAICQRLHSALPFGMNCWRFYE